MSGQQMLVILIALSAVSVTVPLRFIRQNPWLIRRIAEQIDDQGDTPVVVPVWRERRAQPIIDYTDEFSADPFEVALNACIVTMYQMKYVWSSKRKCRHSKAEDNNCAGYA